MDKIAIGVCLCLAFVVPAHAGDAEGDMFLDNGVSHDMTHLLDTHEWTEWLDGDNPTGTGDYENIAVWWYYYNTRRGNCAMTCQKPVAMEWKLVNDDNFDIIDKCVVIETPKMDKASGIYPGFNCMNSKQSQSKCTPNECQTANMRTGKRDLNCDMCPDFRVRYLCPLPEGKVDTRSHTRSCSFMKKELDLQEIDVKMAEAEENTELWEDGAFEEERMLQVVEQNEQEALAEKEEKEKALENENETRKRLLDLLNDLLD